MFGLVCLVAVVQLTSADTRHPISPEILNHNNWPLLDQGTGCGQGAKEGPGQGLSSRIMAGSNAHLGEFPWMAGLYELLIFNEPFLFCGGSVISKRYVLTAAHCCVHLLSSSSNKHFVRLGEYDRNTCLNQQCEPSVVDMYAESAVMNPDYNENNNSAPINDICIIRLKEDIKFTEYVQPVCLPVYEELIRNSFEGVDVTVAGWGRLGPNGDPSKAGVLQETVVPVVPNKMCNEKWVELYPNITITRGHICTGVDRSGLCRGDSGGPLMTSHRALDGPERQFLIGVVSATAKYCHEPNPNLIPNVHARVTEYLLWILDNIHA